MLAFCSVGEGINQVARTVFATRRAYDFLCLDIAEPGLNVNVVGALPGLTTGYGPSHQATEDLAILRAMPGLTIVDPADSVDIEQGVPALAAHPGPTYLRLLRGAVPTVLNEYDYRFEPGKAAELRGGRDVLSISTGLMTVRALTAARELEADHVDVGRRYGGGTAKPTPAASDSHSPFNSAGAAYVHRAHLPHRHRRPADLRHHHRDRYRLL
ncbi:hypothetical protein GCM10010234_69070 [Streptomyces hawaiiensis]